MQGVSLLAKIRVEKRRNISTDFPWNERLLAVYVIKSLIKNFQGYQLLQKQDMISSTDNNQERAYLFLSKVKKWSTFYQLTQIFLEMCLV